MSRHNLAEKTEDIRIATADDISFLVVGCQRCGSTWLHTALQEHPEILLPEGKQTHFFDRYYDKGLAWYLSHFDAITNAHTMVGEVATSYCMTSNMPLIKETFPDIKIIMVMRNPVERAYSFYRSRTPYEDWSDFDDAVSQNPEILSRGQYIEQVDTLLKLYGRKDILFLFYEDLQSNEREYIKRVYEFLGVDATFRPDVIGNPVRASMLPRFRRTLRRMGLTPLVNIVNRSIAGDLIRRILITSRRAKAEPQTKPLKPDRKLYAHFAPYNERLSRTLNCNLDHWTLSETND